MRGEIVVIGAGLGGLSAAIHARLRGYDVLVLEGRSSVGGKAGGIEIDGFRFDPGPSIIILTRIYEQVFRDAGRDMADYLRFRRLDPFSRVYFEGAAPIDLPADANECLRVLGDVAPEDTDAFSRLLRDLDVVSPLIDRSIFARPYTRLWHLIDPALIRVGLRFDVRSTYKDLIDRMFKSPIFRSFFYGFPSYGGQTYDSKAPGALMIPYLMVREGVWYPEGGVAAIPEAFKRLALELGVQFRFCARVCGFELASGRISAALLEGGERIEARAFISNVDRLTTRAWLGHHVDWRPSLSYFTLQWGLDRPISGLGHHTLLVPENFERGFEQLYRESSFPDRPIVYLNATSEADPTVGPPNTTNLFAVVTSPAKEDHLDWERDSLRYRSRVMAEMSRFGFEVEPEIIVVERMQTPTTFEERDGSYRGSLYGPHESHRPWGLFPHSNQDAQIPNLYYAGGSVQPGAGLPMVTLSGKFAAMMLR